MPPLEISDIQQPVECFEVTSAALDLYVNKPVKFERDANANIAVERWLALKGELFTHGLKKLYDLVKSPSGLTVKDVRKRCSNDLLYDLECVTRQQPNSGAPVCRSEFYKELYAEIEDTTHTVSKELLEFLEYCSRPDPKSADATPTSPAAVDISTPDAAPIPQATIDTSAPGTTPPVVTSTRVPIPVSPAIISARMLQKFRTDSPLLVEGLLEELEKEFIKYKESPYTAPQVDKDFDRAALLIKDASGATRIITPSELTGLEILTGEQKEFIKTSWHQGLFGSGWFSQSLGKLSDRLMLQAEKNGHYQQYLAYGSPGHSDFLMIDLSELERVRLYNNCEALSCAVNVELEKTYTKFAHGVLAVDISGLTESSFRPGCASVEPEISAYISTFDKNIELIFPPKSKLMINSGAHLDVLRRTIIKGSTEAHIQAIGSFSDAARTAGGSKHHDEVKRSANALVGIRGREKGNDLILKTILNSQRLSDIEKTNTIYTVYDNDKLFLGTIKSFVSEISAKEQLKLLPDEQDKNLKKIEPVLSENKATAGEREIGEVILKIPELEKNISSAPLDSPFAYNELAVKNYCILEENQGDRLRFANRQLEEYCGVHPLDQTDINEVREAFIAILDPVCENETAKQLLRAQAEQIEKIDHYQPGILESIMNAIQESANTLASYFESNAVAPKEPDLFADSAKIFRKHMANIDTTKTSDRHPAPHSTKVPDSPGGGRSY